MKTFQRIVPVVAVVLALGGAIYYVQSNAPVRPEPIQVSKAPAVSPSRRLPLELASASLPMGSRWKRLRSAMHMAFPQR